MPRPLQQHFWKATRLVGTKITTGQIKELERLELLGVQFDWNAALKLSCDLAYLFIHRLRSDYERTQQNPNGSTTV